MRAAAGSDQETGQRCNRRSEIVKNNPFLFAILLVVLLVGCTAPTPTEVMPETPGIEITSPFGDLAGTEPPDSVAIETTPEIMETTPPLAPMEVSEPEGVVLPELPACSGVLTSANMEGPYYSTGAPQRTSLIDPGMPGVPILILGRVFDQECNPIAGAKVDFWQADMNGDYDNAGYTLRGYVISGEDGYYDIETIEPGLYTGRPAHIHVKVFDPDGKETLTTQLYFPGSEGSRDVSAAPDLLVSYAGQDEAGRELVFFNFVVAE
jgi:hypothetical protein